MNANLHIGSEPPQQNPKEYLTIKEVAQLTGRKAQTIRNLMSKKIFRLGKHYFKPNGGHPLFKRSAIIAWIEGETT